jgi:hypothetical protein
MVGFMFYDGAALFCSAASALNCNTSWVHTKCCAELCNKKMSRRAVFPTLPLRCSSEAALHDSGLGLASVIKAETTFLLPQRTNDAIAATGDLFYIGPS